MFRPVVPALVVCAAAAWATGMALTGCTSDDLRPVAAPPAPLPEAPQSPPAPGMVWVPGCWHWDGEAYVWLPGHWK